MEGIYTLCKWDLQPRGISSHRLTCDPFRGLQSFFPQWRQRSSLPSVLLIRLVWAPYAMLFVRYLSNDGRELSQDDSHQYDPNFPVHPSQSGGNGGQGSSSYVHEDDPPLQFQFPYFMALSSSTVAPGGGAEVLPFSHLQPTGEFPPDWLSSSYFPFPTGDQ